MISGATAGLDTAVDTAAGVLAFARDRRAAADAAEADLLRAACAWAALHPAESITDAVRFGDTPVPVAGPGAPLVAEFCVAEFAAAVGLPTESGKAYLGEAVELRHRLPRIWARVVAGDLAAWRARRIARQTIGLSLAAAGFVDVQVAGFAHRIRPSVVDRLVQEAIVRFMPEEARRRGRPRPMAGMCMCTPIRCPSRARYGWGPRSTWPTPWTWTPPCRPAPPGSRTSAPPRRSAGAPPNPSGGWPPRRRTPTP